MHIVRYRTGRRPEVRIGTCRDGRVTELPGTGSLAELWSLPLDQLRARLAESAEPAAPPDDTAPTGDVELSTVELLAPVDGRTEIWAAGVTYQISREARVEESERAASVYELVYDAPRPELFLKSVAWRAVGPGRALGIRVDSIVDVPEPELALVVNRFGEIVGYTICNDVSSRSIEGENPLYLPQAKLFYGCCGLGPWIRPAWEVPDPYDLAIELSIVRDGGQVWSGTATTGLLHRRLEDLVGYLMRGDVHPDGVILSTGTCLVPPAPFTLDAGDTVRITIAGVGTLTNTVTRGRPAQ